MTLAPILFGWIASLIAPGNAGLKCTFRIKPARAPVLVASSLAIPARHAYPWDVTTADASAKAVPSQQR